MALYLSAYVHACLKLMMTCSALFFSDSRYTVFSRARFLSFISNVVYRDPNTETPAIVFIIIIFFFFLHAMSKKLAVAHLGVKCTQQSSCSVSYAVNLWPIHMNALLVKNKEKQTSKQT